MIRKARKLPVEIEYLTFKDIDDEFIKVTDFSKPHKLFSNMVCKVSTKDGTIISWTVNTLTGIVIMDKDFHLLIGVDGELYPCRIDIFNETYEVINNEK